MWLSWFVVLALVLGYAVASGWEDGEAPVAQRRAATHVATIAQRVEAIRELSFRRAPAPETVSPQQARDEALEALDSEYPAAEREADAALMRLLGLVEEDVDFEELYASIFETQVAGYYDTVTERLRIVSGAGSASRAYTEIILAHELTHALEDQVFDLSLAGAEGLGDEGLAYSALVEGTASALMFEYAARHLTGEEVLVGLLGSAFAPPGDLPAFLQARLLFPYTAGQALAERLYRASGDWTLIDAALRHRPPASTEQVIHPDAYLRFEAPERVRLSPAADPGWRSVASGTLGEWQTAELLRGGGGGGAATAAAGWGGDRYVLLRGPSGDFAVVVRWVWDSAGEHDEFLPALERFAASGAPGGAAVVRSRGGAVTLAVARDAALAEHLARSR